MRVFTTTLLLLPALVIAIEAAPQDSASHVAATEGEASGWRPFRNLKASSWYKRWTRKENATTAEETTMISTTPAEEEGNGKAVTYPCKCNDGVCSCCTGNVLENFNVNMRQRLCTNLTFDPEDFTIGMKEAFNDRVLYQNRLSGKNPPPICLPIPRISALRVCLRLSNVYLIGRNIHACLMLETQWNKETNFAFNFDCVRLGRDGVALVRPEDGGGLPVPAAPVDPAVDGIEEYDENIVAVDKPPVG